MKAAIVFSSFISIALVFSGTGGATQSTALFTQAEKDSIIKHFNDIGGSNVPCMTWPIEKVIEASRGMYISQERSTAKEKLCAAIDDAYEAKEIPFVHDDSLTAWGNSAAERYGLEIKDILKMQAGKKMKVILMDRNVGDYLDGTNPGTKIVPTKEGFTYATYTHKKDLMGDLDLYEIGHIKIDFEWEINLASLGSDTFWGIRPSDIALEDLNPRIKVGWRGPAIRLGDVRKKMPKYVTHYDNWWNDYLPFRKHDFLK